ncbi:MAG: hypothetical protein HC840_27695 [Leptolyngbyaceae cyanobacterium RM2_2_4]|nr:hypothetical protein [Leptolyngbyaceae cyanobacterium RM2_2_4]
MATVQETAFSKISELNLWYKLRSDQQLTLTDVPELIRRRWDYFRDRWEFLKPTYEQRVQTYENKNLLNNNIRDFTLFIDSQRTQKQNPFSNINIVFQFYGIFDTTPTTQVPLSPEEETLIQDKIQKINLYTRDDFVNIRNTLVQARDQLVDIRGLPDDDYNRVKGRASIAKQTDATNKDINDILQINQAIKSVEFILANKFQLETSFVDPFALARTNANNPDVQIGSYSSGFLVKMNYNQDLRQLAKQFFDDEQRWIDIAIANGLKPPYIDEIGQRLPLIANGRLNKVTIRETDEAGRLNIDKFYINQVVFIQSDTVRFPDQRVIINIEQVPISGDIILELDGEENLDQYKINVNAHIRVFKPNTINSNFYVLIPTEEVIDDTRTDEEPWFLRTSPDEEKRLKVDLSIDENGELNFNQAGDLNLSYGLDNGAQALRLKMGVSQNELRQHNSFGLVNLIGKTNLDVATLQATLEDSINRAIEADPRFDRIETLNIRYTVDRQNPDAGAGMNVRMTVRIAGSGSVIPISFRINTQGNVRG